MEEEAQSQTKMLKYNDTKVRARTGESKTVKTMTRFASHSKYFKRPVGQSASLCESAASYLCEE